MIKVTDSTKKPIRLKGKKKLMLEALKGQLGVITSAAKQLGISRRTHYRWIGEDENYKKAIEELPELVLDFVENALFKKIQEGDAPSIHFYLKHKGRIRGYLDMKYVKAEVSTRSYNITIQEPKQILEIISNETIKKTKTINKEENKDNNKKKRKN